MSHHLKKENMKKYNLNFHRTFPPTAEYITRLLEVCDHGDALTKEQISELTGIPTGTSSGKVEPHIFYGEYMGLLRDVRAEGKHRLLLTPLGKEILNQDPGLQEKVSTAVCHARITSRFDGAILWTVLFKEMLPKFPQGINEVLLKDELEKKFEIPVKTAPFFSAYSGMFDNLALISKTGNLIRLEKGTIDRELLYVYAYALLYEWENAFPNQSEITSVELSSLSISETFALAGNTFYEIIEQLAERGIVRFNRQLAPYTLLRLHSSEDIIPSLYSELC